MEVGWGKLPVRLSLRRKVNESKAVVYSKLGIQTVNGSRRVIRTWPLREKRISEPGERKEVRRKRKEKKWQSTISQISAE